MSSYRTISAVQEQICATRVLVMYQEYTRVCICHTRATSNISMGIIVGLYHAHPGAKGLEKATTGDRESREKTTT